MKDNVSICFKLASDTVNEIDAVVSETQTSRAWVLRQAIAAGLPRLRETLQSTLAVVSTAKDTK